MMWSCLEPWILCYQTIAALQLALLNRLWRSKVSSLNLTSVYGYHLGAGYDPVYGARPLKRAVVRLIENPLAEAMLGDGFAAGSVLCGDWQDDRLVIRSEKIIA